MAEEYKIAEHVIVQDQLSPVIFDENAKMFETVRTGLQRIADYWWDNALGIFPDFKLKEVVLYGDIAGYVYNKKSEEGKKLATSIQNSLNEAIQKEINRLKNEEKVDYIILLGHLGILGDALEENTSEGVI